MKKLRERYGDNAFEVEVRRRCKSPTEALRIESRVHRLFDVAASDLWLNRHRAGSKFCNPGKKGAVRSADHCKAISDGLKGLKKSAEHVAKIAAAKTGVKQASETIRKRVEKNKGQRWTEEMKSSHRSRMLETNADRIHLNLITLERRRLPEPLDEHWIPWHANGNTLYHTPWGTFPSAKAAGLHTLAVFKDRTVISRKCKAGEEGYSRTRLQMG